MDIEKEQAILDLKLLRDEYCKTIPEYQKSINYVLNELEKYKTKYENLKSRHKGTKEALRVSEDLEKHFSEEASTLEAELKEKDKIIDLIVKEFYKKAHISTKCYLQVSIEECLKKKNCIVCIKEYFEKKCKG